MNTKTQELVTAGYALAKGLDAESEKLVTQLADALAVQRVRADELNRQVVNLAVENSTVRERHHFIRALAVSILEHSGGRMDWRGAMEDARELIKTVNAVYVSLPATDLQLASIQAQYREEGINFTASRLCAAYNNGFIDKPLNEVADIVRMILTAKEDITQNPAADGLSGEYAEKSLEEFAAELRKGAAV